MTTNIYVLKLNNNKFYVGKSFNPEKRFLEHLSGDGSTWTKKYEPIEIETIIPNASHFDEDKYVKEYMNKYGIDNVRGGSYVKEILDDIEIYSLKKEIWAATDCCTQCGRKGHYIKNCFANTDVYRESLLIWQCEYCDSEFKNEDECEKHEKFCNNKKNIVIYTKAVSQKCFTCGKPGHYTSECYSKKFASKSYSKKPESKSYSKKPELKSSSTNKCYRCGREGHFSPDCYASKHVKGYYIDSD